ncbi:MAG TPA: hypothetical protein VEB42_15790 [Chitinophagaceae bacterium]|nr:hypothetical protein [Chitinophagaceae bacterium]
MRIELILCSLALLSATCTPQRKEFEGRVHYVYAMTRKMGATDSTSSDASDSSIYSYKKGKYRWDYPNQGAIFQLSDPYKNLNVVKYENIDTLYKILSLPEDTLLSYRLTKNAGTICGYVCDKLEAEVKSSLFPGITKRTQWYNTGLYADPQHFKNDRSLATYQLVSIARAIPLAFELDNSVMHAKWTAIKVEPGSISDDVFKLNSSLPIGTISFRNRE